VTSVVLPDARARILQAALTLLETGGAAAVSTRTVSAAADVQPPTIYRHFGDMQGLLDEVARAGFTAYLEAKVAHSRRGDPVEELRGGWNSHVEFGLTHPHLYTLMYRMPQLSAVSPAALEGAAMLRGLMQRVAQAGRLKVSVDRASTMFHAACKGVTLSLLGNAGPDLGLSDHMREAMLETILMSGLSAQTDATPSPRQQMAVHAVSLVALLPSAAVPLSAAEQQLMLEWLERLT
jgi:AcrR family transcriptional regulator